MNATWTRPCATWFLWGVGTLYTVLQKRKLKLADVKQYIPGHTPEITPNQHLNSVLVYLKALERAFLQIKEGLRELPSHPVSLKNI